MADIPVIELRGVGKTYYNADVATPVLFDMSFQVGRGEFVAIVGGSGSGKTTLLNLMGLLDRPTTGEILVDGRNAGTLDELGRASVRRDRLGFIFQFHYLLPEFTRHRERADAMPHEGQALSGTTGAAHARAARKGRPR
jgi:lipoprotein-releasing system ATP-binding protein